MLLNDAIADSLKSSSWLIIAVSLEISLSKAAVLESRSTRGVSGLFANSNFWSSSLPSFSNTCNNFALPPATIDCSEDPIPPIVLSLSGKFFIIRSSVTSALPAIPRSLYLLTSFLLSLVRLLILLSR